MTGYLGVPDIIGQRRMATSQNDVKRALERAQNEMVTGEKSNRVAASGGDTSRLMGLDRSIAEITARAPRLEMARTRSAVAQTALETIRGAVGDLGVTLQDNALMRAPTAMTLRGREAEEALKQTLSALNTTVGGRALFGGAQGTGPTVASADDVIAAVLAALNSDPDPVAALAAAEAAIDATLYTGSTNDGPEVELATGERVRADVRADDPALKGLIRGLALAAALPASIQVADETARETVLSAAGDALLDNAAGVTTLTASLGLAEARIENALSRGVAERTALSIARNDMIGRDEFEAASEIAELESRLETIYAITSRMANLSFVNFFR